jgi:hypothetical protein
LMQIMGESAWGIGCCYGYRYHKLFSPTYDMYIGTIHY